MTTTNVTTAQAKAGLIASPDTKWIGDITYSIPGAGASWVSGYGKGEPVNGQYGVLNTDQANAFRSVMSDWNALIANAMPEVSDASPGRIRVAFTDATALNGSNTAGYAYLPPTNGGEGPTQGDVWLDEVYKPLDFSRGTDSYVLLLHEVGHALGLKHSFESPTVPAGYDSNVYTVMSYTREGTFFKWYSTPNSLGNFNGPVAVYTPMVLDIAAIQAHYGRDTATASGNTVYKYVDSDLDGRRAIYDAGGTDTLDLSALSRGSHVDLRPGAYSDLAYYKVADQIEDLVDKYGEGQRNFITSEMSRPGAYQWEKNFGIAFSTVIENVSGSKSSDQIIGNTADNVISSGGGAADTMQGLGGNDTYRVYNAADVIVEAASEGTADYVNAAVSYILGAGVYVETLRTNSGAATTAIDLTGNALKQTITGNAGANVLSTGGGAADTMQGLGGNDTYRVYNAADVIVETASQGTADIVNAAVSYVLGSGVYVETLRTNSGAATTAIDLTGNSIAQKISGNAGDNVVDGKGGNDTISTLGGKDFIVFSTALGAGNVDTISDFNVASDTMRLDDAIFKALTLGTITSDQFRANTTGEARDATDRIVYDKDSGGIFYDADGLGGTAGVQFAAVGLGLAITNADFVVV